MKYHVERESNDDDDLYNENGIREKKGERREK